MSEPFLDKLYLMAEGPLSRGFEALTGRPSIHWLLPIRAEFIRELDLRYLIRLGQSSGLAGVKFWETGTATEPVLNVAFAGKTKSYPKNATSKEMVNDPRLDIRIWPDFKLSHLPRLPERPADRVYFIRIRQKRSWDLSPAIVAHATGENGESLGFGLYQLERLDTGWEEDFNHHRQARLYQFRVDSVEPLDGAVKGAHYDPVGLYFEGRGLLLFRLRSIYQQNSTPIPWRIGVDFGTSNTCVSFKNAVSTVTGGDEVIDFTVQTVTMLENPRYDESDGVSAIFDFPFRYGAADLLPEVYFPSQMVTSIPDHGLPQHPEFRMAHGLILPINVITASKEFQNLRSFPPPLKNDQRVFRLLQDIKWTNRAFRQAFLWHLYKMITFHAASRGARVVEAAFSFPRAFDCDSIVQYTNEARTVFGFGGIPVRKTDIVSESTCVQRILASEKSLDDQVVFDFGGGTTDVLGVFGRGARFQASFIIAGGCVDDYFCESPIFRQAMYDAVWSVLSIRPLTIIQQNLRAQLYKLLKVLEELPTREMGKVVPFSRQLFFGLLSAINDSEYPNVGEFLKQRCSELCESQDADEDDSENVKEIAALRGFFLTLVMLFCGVAYQAAQLMRQHKIVCTNMQPILLGNGSRLCRLLGNEKTALRPLFDAIMKKAGPNPNIWTSSPDIRVRGKAMVALGLLAVPDRKGDAPVIPDLVTLAHYSALTEQKSKNNKVTLKVFKGFENLAAQAINEAQKLDTPNDCLAEFADLLSDIIDSGKIAGKIVIPGMSGKFNNNLRPLLNEARKRSREKELKNATLFKEALNHAEKARAAQITSQEQDWLESAQAVEPVFITRLKSLIEVVREKFCR
jgi:hypothetical protein